MPSPAMLTQPREQEIAEADLIELNQQLREARVPGRSPGYSESFPKRVVARLEQAKPEPAPTAWVRWRWAVVTVCALVLVAGLGWRFWPRPASVPVDYAKLAREIAREFPGQLKAIIVDENGLRVELAESATVADSAPVLVEVCRPRGCQRVITFSGQQIKINGELWDVLVNGQGQVIVAGRSTGNYRVQGSVL